MAPANSGRHSARAAASFEMARKPRTDYGLTVCDSIQASRSSTR
jgi:hypothetical protein